MNYKNYTWIYVHEDEWDQDKVLLETWFLADYDIQSHILLSFEIAPNRTLIDKDITRLIK